MEGNINNGNVIGMVGGNGGGGASPEIAAKVETLEQWQANPHNNIGWYNAYMETIREMYGDDSILLNPFSLAAFNNPEYFDALDRYMTDVNMDSVWVPYDYYHMACVTISAYDGDFGEYDNVIMYDTYIPFAEIHLEAIVCYTDGVVTMVTFDDPVTFIKLLQRVTKMMMEVGDLSMLQTATKSTIVAAINEVNSNATGGTSSDYVIDNGDSPSLPLLCGQPMILFGAGTPQEAIVPDNWKQFDPETEEGYNWTGVPSALGQIYVNRSVSTNSRYIAVRDGNYSLKWIQ